MAKEDDEVKGGAAAPLTDPAETLTMLGYFDAEADPETCAHHLSITGCCAVRGAVPSAQCSALAAFVDRALQSIDQEMEMAAAAGGDAADHVDLLQLKHFGNVRNRYRRFDLKLPLVPEVQRALASLATSIGEVLKDQVSEAARVAELACLVSDPGAECQTLHWDTPCEGNRCAALLTTFVALQPVTASTGPTLLCPGTHTPEAQATLEEARRFSEGEEELLQRFGAAEALCEVGTAVIMDSRLLHCGGANRSACEGGRRRRLFYATWQLPGNAPSGSTYSIRDELCGRLRLADLPDGPRLQQCVAECREAEAEARRPH